MKNRSLRRRAALSLLFVLPACLLAQGCSKRMKIKVPAYPDTRMEEVADDYHGTAVADPYRWLEDDNSAQTAAWVAAQNEVTEGYLSQIPYRTAVKQRLTELYDYPKEGVPSKQGDWYYFFRNDGLQNQSVYYRTRSFDDQPEVFFDPNTLSEDGTKALTATSFSRDGRYFAYAVSASGSDWVEIKVKDTQTGEELPDLIRWVKFSGARWASDSKGFYYSRYDAPGQGAELSGQNRFQKVYYHRLGDLQERDRLIYKDDAHPLRYFRGGESSDGKYVFISASEGTHGNEILFREAARPGAPMRVLLPGFANDYDVIYCRGDRAVVLTNDGAPKFRICQIDLKAPTPELKDLVPESEYNLEGAKVVGGYIVAFYLRDATSAVSQFDLDGNPVREVELPGIGTVSGFGGREETVETFYSFTSFTSPAEIYSYSLTDGQSRLLRRPELKFDTSLFTTDQVFFTSRDGTRVPMFVVHRKDMKLDGRNPLHMYGYGGFNISRTPEFSSNVVMFLEQGGVYVSVSLRGGGEYGEEWHRAGMLENKQNVFDDFIAAAEYLIEKKYTSPGKLAISGGSNGGLLVGACMTQRPDLFAVAVPQVGVLDMLRYHRFTVGWGWVVEYGDPDNAEQFPYIYKYSPLHNLHKGTCYPATLITTADHDDRVVPAHSFKFAAALQAAQGCDRPALIRIDTKAGHGAGKPTSKRIEEAADVYSFIFWNTGAKVKFGK